MMFGAGLKRWTLMRVAVLSALLAASCEVGPNYHAPKVPMPGQWTGLASNATGNLSTATADTAQLAKWWEAFHDPELDALIVQATQSNLGLKEAQARILQAREARAVAGAGLWPNANVSGAITTSNSGASAISSGAGGGSSGSTHNLFEAGVDAAWELDFFGGVRRGVEAANSNVQAAIEDSRDVLVTLTSEVALNYIELRGVQQELAITKNNLEAQQKTAEITHKRYSVGFANGLDVANAEAQVSTTQAQIPVLEASAQQAIYALGVLLGREPAALLAELTPEGKIPDTPPLVPMGLPSDLLERRPDIRRAEAQLHSATAQIGVATADLFPRISLTGSATGQVLTAGSLGSLATHFWSMGPSVTMPVFSAGKIRANIRLQKAVEEQTLLAYKQTVLSALQDVESALIAYSKDQPHREALAEAVKSNRIAVDLSTRLYTAGEAEFLNLLTAQRNLYVSEEALVQSERTIDTDLVALYKALGGGWE